MYILPPDHDFLSVAAMARNVLAHYPNVSTKEIMDEITASTKEQMGFLSDVVVAQAIDPLRVAIERLMADPSKSDAEIARETKAELVENEIQSPTTDAQLDHLVDAAFAGISSGILNVRREAESLGNVKWEMPADQKASFEVSMHQELEQTAREFRPNEPELLARAKKEASKLISELTEDSFEKLEGSLKIGLLDDKQSLRELSASKLRAYRDMAVARPVVHQDLEGRIERKRQEALPDTKVTPTSPKLN